MWPRPTPLLPATPNTRDETSLANIANWGPSEECCDRTDAKGERWFAATLAATGAVTVVALTRTPSDGVVNFDDIHTLPRNEFRRRITRRSSTKRPHELCRTLRAGTGC